MATPTFIKSKLEELAEHVDRIRAHRPRWARELSEDRDRLDLVAFNLMLAVQICGDVANHLLVDERWGSAGTIAAALGTLRERGVLAPATANALLEAAEQQVVIAHGYGAVDPVTVHAIAARAEEDFGAFAGDIAGWFSRRRP